jgi:hypothetical protein
MIMVSAVVAFDRGDRGGKAEIEGVRERTIAVEEEDLEKTLLAIAITPKWKCESKYIKLIHELPETSLIAGQVAGCELRFLRHCE